MTDGNVPSDMALGSHDGLEEERRVLYVALTRARNALHLYMPERYHHHPYGRDDRHGWAQPSRFLTDRVRARCEEIAAANPTAALDARPVEAFDRIGVALDGLWS